MLPQSPFNHSRRRVMSRTVRGGFLPRFDLFTRSKAEPMCGREFNDIALGQRRSLAPRGRGRGRGRGRRPWRICVPATPGIRITSGPPYRPKPPRYQMGNGSTSKAFTRPPNRANGLRLSANSGTRLRSPCDPCQGASAWRRSNFLRWRPWSPNIQRQDPRRRLHRAPWFR